MASDTHRLIGIVQILVLIEYLTTAESGPSVAGNHHLAQKSQTVICGVDILLAGTEGAILDKVRAGDREAAER